MKKATRRVALYSIPAIMATLIRLRGHLREAKESLVSGRGAPGRRAKSARPGRVTVSPLAGRIAVSNAA